MYDKLGFLSPFLIPPSHNEGRMKGERSSQIGFHPVFHNLKIIHPMSFKFLFYLPRLNVLIGNLRYHTFPDCFSNITVKDGFQED